MNMHKLRLAARHLKLARAAKDSPPKYVNLALDALLRGDSTSHDYSELVRVVASENARRYRAWARQEIASL